MLAVVLPSSPTGGMVSLLSQQLNYTDFYTHWAMDPILHSVTPDTASPKNEDFRLNPVFDQNLQYPGQDSRRANVAAYPVVFDENRQQWYCDLAIEPKAMYFPFVKLALARYQPYSVKKEKEDVCLSSVVLSTFIQLVPERQTTVRVSGGSGAFLVNATVEGTIFNERIARYGNRTFVRFSFFDSLTNQPISGIVNDGKTPKDLSDLGTEEFVAPKDVSNNRFTLSREFRLPQKYRNSPIRLLVEEFETGPKKIGGDNIDQKYAERLEQSEETDRLIYADVIELNR
jgi:hypothetical protein